jgi:hypothetical protein
MISGSKHSQDAVCGSYLDHHPLASHKTIQNRARDAWACGPPCALFCDHELDSYHICSDQYVLVAIDTKHGDFHGNAKGNVRAIGALRCGDKLISLGDIRYSYDNSGGSYRLVIGH